MFEVIAIDGDLDLDLDYTCARVDNENDFIRPRTSQCRRSAIWSSNINGEDRIWLPGSNAVRAATR